ncbi:MAG: 16S rRNA (cytosine(1402)-N(4))-methyltransferase RsmH [Minisyncoccia bacterium]
MHKSVLLHEAIDGLEIKKGDVFVDCTLGSGGHSLEVAKRFGDSVVMIGIDLDPNALERSRKQLTPYRLNISYVEDSFKNIKSILSKLKITKADKILLDLGLSSDQFENSGRGFTFQKDEPLSMNFREKIGPTDLRAMDILNTWEEKNIATILRNYGEEEFAWKIAKAVTARREVKPIVTTLELVEIIKIATPKWYHYRKIHPATKTFQALRIAVNDEIENLKNGLIDGFESLSTDGRMAVISFHSLEDREVKHYFRKVSEDKSGKIITKKPITPKMDEIIENPRSRSAKLRIIEKII